MKKIFIIYSHKDEENKNIFIDHLRPLVDHKLIEIWNSREIEFGEWEPQIEKAINEADYFFPFITFNFMNSEFIREMELPTAYKKYKGGKSTIIPIIYGNCIWESIPVSYDEKEYNEKYNLEMYPLLGKFQAQPKDGKAISNYKDKHKAFKEIAEFLANDIFKKTYERYSESQSCAFYSKH